jgi:hypothetical protein
VVLLQRNRLDQQIVACSDKVKYQNLMVTRNGKDTLVVANCVARSEIHNDSIQSLGWHDTSSSTQREDVSLISEKLVGRRQL